MKRLLLFLLLVLVSLPISAQYLTEDFESAWSGTPPAPSSWTQTRIRAINHATAEKDWLQNTWTGSAWTFTGGTTPASGAYSGTGVAWIDDYNYMSSSTPQASSRLESPVVNLSGSTSPYIRFWYFNNQGVGVTLNLRVMVSSNNGTTWDVLTPIVNGFTVTASTWNRISVAIPAPYRTANFKFAFEITNRWGTSNPFIDLVTVEEFTPTTITSAATGDWNTGATWVGGTVPTADNNVVIAAGHTVTTSSTSGIIGRCQNLTIDATGILNHSTGTANLIHAYGNITVNGTLNAYNGTSGRFIYCGGDFTINSGGTANFSAGTTSQSTGSTTISTGAAGIVFLNNQSASFTNGGTLTSNYIQNIMHIGQGNFTYNNTVNCYRTFGLYLGSVNPNGNLTLGNAAASGTTQSVERANGTFTANPIWNNTNITSRSNYYYSPNWVPITQATLLTGNEVESIAGVRTVSGTFSMNTHNNLQLNYPLTVGTATTGSMTLTRGIILTDDTNLLSISAFYAGPTGTAPSTATPSTTHGSYVVGPVQINFPATGTTTRNFPLGVGTGFNGSTPNSNVLKYIAVASTSAWTGSVIKASIVGAPSGTVNSPLTNLFGIRAYRLQLVSGSDLPGTATVSIRGRNSTFGNSDGLYGDIGELRVAQSPSLTGAWTERSTTSGSGGIVNNTDYARTTAVAAPGPIAPLGTYGEYFALATTATVINPSGVTATPITNSQIDVAFTPNIFSNNVVIVWNSSGTFTAPSGTPTVGGSLASGTVLFVGTAPSPYNHTSLSAGTIYYYKVFSYDGTNYSPGVTANATTYSLVAPPYSEGFATTSTPTGWNITGWTIGSARGVTGNPGNNIYKNLYSSATTGTFTLIDVGPIASGMFLYFDYIAANYASPYAPPAAGSGNYVVSVSTDWGASYTTLETVVNDGVAGWRTKSYDLTAYTGSNVRVRIVGNWVSGDYDLAFDNFKIETPPTYPPPTALTATGITATSANLGWTQSGSPVSWDIEYGVSPYTFTGTPTLTGVTNPYTLTPLSPSTTYQYMVRANFGGGNYSTWAGPQSFSTLCGDITSYPYNKPFATTTIPVCWSMSGPQSWLFTTSWPGYGAAGLTDHTPGGGTNFAGVDGSGTAGLTGITLLSETFNVSSLSAPRLKFYLFNNNTSSVLLADEQQLKVDIWDGAAWNLAAFTWAYGQNAAGWQEIVINLGSYTITGPIQLRFVVDKGSGSPFYDDIIIDDVTIDAYSPDITYTALTHTNSTSNRTLSGVSITKTVGPAVDWTNLPRLYYKKKSNANAFGGANNSTFDGWKYVTASPASSPTSFTIDYSLLYSTGSVSVGDTVQYFVVAQDLSGTPVVASNPSGGFVGTSVSSITSAPITPNQYKIVGTPLSGNYTISVVKFNELAGKNLTFEKRTRKVLTDVPVGYKQTGKVKGTNNIIESKKEMAIDGEVIKTDLENNKSSNVTESSAIVSFRDENIIYEKQEIDEDYYVLIENGSIYKGEQFITGEGLEGVEAAYTTITAAITDLNERGVSGPVNFLLGDATYPSETFPLTINPVVGGSVTNTVTIKPSSGVTPTVSGASASNAIFKILSSNVIIDGSNSGGTTRDLTIQNTSATAPTTVAVGSIGTTPTTKVTVKNCVIINTTSASAVVVSDGTTLGNDGYFNDITIQNNSIQSAFIGSYNRAFVSAGNGSGLIVRENDLNTSGANAISYIGIYLQGVDGGTVSNNNIGNFVTTESNTDAGIWMATGTKNTVIEKNKIDNIGYTGTLGYGANGIKVSSGVTGANITVRNNFISNLYGDGDSYITFAGTYNPVGIYIFTTQTDIKVYFNSIYLTGNTINYSADAASFGVFLNTGSVADVRNNIIVNNLGLLSTTGLGAVGVYLATSSSQLSQSNYNNIFVAPNGSGVKEIGRIVSTGYTTLSAWQTATGQDANSKNAAVTFASATDLHLFGSSIGDINLRGTPIAGITTDIDNETRNTLAPYIGADEIPGTPPVPKLNLTALVQEFYRVATNDWYPDVVTAELRETTTPWTTVIDQVNINLDANGVGTGNFFVAADATNYYLVIKHRNSLETWSKNPVQFTSGALTYDFTTAATQAYGDNLVLKGGEYCMYSGDINQDGSIDALDRSLAWNDRNLSGYQPSDVNGDGTVDALDRSICWNNRNLGKKWPGGTVIVKPVQTDEIKDNVQIKSEN